MGFGGFGSPQWAASLTIGGSLTVGTGITLSSGVILAPDGSTSAPGYSFTNGPTYGLAYASGGGPSFDCIANGTSILRVHGAGVNMHAAGYYAFGSSATGTPDTFLYRDDAATLQMGVDVNGAAVAQTFKAHDGITGTDIAGAGITFASGRGTGAGASGGITLSTSTTLGTGTTAQTLVARLTLSRGAVTTDAATLTFADQLNMVFNTTTGTKIGTAGSQKLAFYGATPIIQQTGVAVTAAGIHAALVNLGLITA